MKTMITALAIVISSYMSHDIPEPDVANLAVERPEITAEENAYTYFLSATDGFYWPTDSDVVSDYLDGKTVHQQDIADVISKNKDKLDLVKRGVQCRRCITPEVTGFDTPLHYLSPWRDIGQVLAAKVRYERIAGHYAEATDTCITLLKFGDLIQQDAGGIFNYFTGISIQERGLRQARDLARDPGMSSPEFKKLSDALASLGPFAPGLIRAIKVQYKLTANLIDDFDKANLSKDKASSLFGTEPPSILKGRVIPVYFFQPNSTKLMFANHYRNRIINAPLPYTEMNLDYVENVPGFGESKLKLLTRPNAIGNIIYSLILPALFAESKCRAECRVAATHLLVTINHYKKEKGVLPESLEELVPAYMAEIPKDPYDGEQFRYDPQKRIVYSVGTDGKDSGGSTVLLSGNESDPIMCKRGNSEDIVFKIEKAIEDADFTEPSETLPSTSSDGR